MEPEQDPYAPARPPSHDELTHEEAPRHRQQMALLVETLNWHYRDGSDVYIGANMAVYFSALEVARPAFKAPDFFVVLGADQDRVRRSWVAWEEGGAVPDVIVELLSDSTASEDRGRKMRLYAHAGVATYYLYDPYTSTFEGYVRDVATRGWRALAPAADGSLACEPLGLRLQVLPGTYEGEGGRWLRFLDPNGRPLPTPAEAERERAEAERERAVRAEARAAAAEAELAQLRALLAAREG